MQLPLTLTAIQIIIITLTEKQVLKKRIERKVVPSGELVQCHRTGEERVTERHRDLHSIKKEETSGML